MKRPVRLLSLIAAAALAVPALAGDIVKCVDVNGNVTLTDQPCGADAAAVPLARDAAVRATAARGASVGSARAPQRHVLPAADLPHPASKQPNLAAPVQLARDVATLKEARRMLMLQDVRPRLAGLD